MTCSGRSGGERRSERSGPDQAGGPVVTRRLDGACGRAGWTERGRMMTGVMEGARSPGDANAYTVGGE
eukprot:1178605-Prorocentrum_minimum.AAC.1